ncbi:hypothetical protein DPV78_000137 [Talaromyces pinophilus]|nr:hypothetical protein DPV78_000137 [Talaromyces pinophilus]
MDFAVSSPQPTIPPNQRRRSLLELFKKLRELADMQVKPEMEDVESVPEFCDLIHQLCQEELAVAQAIAAAIREIIPDPSPRLSSKRKRREDPHAVQSVLRKKQCTNDENTVDEPMTPESPVPENDSENDSPEAEDALDSMVCVETAELRSAYKYESKLDVHSTTPAMDENAPQSKNIYHKSTEPTSPDRERTESPPVPKDYSTENMSFLDTIHQMVDIIHLLNQHPNDSPRTHSGADHGLNCQSLVRREDVDGGAGEGIGHKSSVFRTQHAGIYGRLEMCTVYTMENKPVGEKGAAMHVLNRITYEYSLLSRKLIINQFSRGKKLRVLVEELGLGILFSPKIWSYTKRNEAQFNQLLQEFKADTQRMSLFRVEQLVQSGSTDLEELYSSLRQHDLKLEAKRALNGADTSQIPFPNAALKTAYNQLISRVSNQVIQAAMQITDQPAFVHFRESIPVNDIGRFGRMRLIKKPFGAWKKEIAKLHRKVEIESEGYTPLVFYSPIHQTDSHFTLLKIDDGEKVIRHYDSLAELMTINGTKKTRIATLVEPTPQQSDDWSCGARVIWAFKKRCNGFDIRLWDTVLDSERIQLGIINSLIACTDSNAMQKYSQSRECGVRGNASISDGLSEEGSKQSYVELICID